MPICPTCGSIFPDTVGACPVCGHPAQERTPAEETGAGSPAAVFSTVQFKKVTVPPSGTGTPQAEETVRETKEPDARPEDQPLRPGGGLAGKLTALAAVIALIGLIFGIVLPLIRSANSSDISDQEAYLVFLKGSWLSEPFVYADGETPSRELLTIREDFTYECLILTSPSADDTFDSKTWTVSDTDSGSFRIDTEHSALVVSYTGPDGVNTEYSRYIRKLNGESLVLREYYNEQLSDYYDVNFRKAVR